MQTSVTLVLAASLLAAAAPSGVALAQMSGYQPGIGDCHAGAPRAPSVNATTAKVKLGTVKCWNAAKGYGFITPDEGGPEPLAHFSEMDVTTAKTMQRGVSVAYEPHQGAKYFAATKVRMATPTESAARKPYVDPVAYKLAQCRAAAGKDYEKLAMPMRDCSRMVLPSAEQTQAWLRGCAQYPKTVDELKGPGLTQARCDAVQADYIPFSKAMMDLRAMAKERPGIR